MVDVVSRKNLIQKSFLGGVSGLGGTKFQGSRPRIVKLGDFPGCPCGGTHVSDISELGNMKVTQMRTKKGVTKPTAQWLNLDPLRKTDF
ncbi:Threonyl/alanyl tRNA synthetase, class II-like, putative editing domain-containing protein [Cynara cardunculus var. scolymus]|uniref:Threonyl/alanyl tRNA synthetase, class II-like, putative editing domain-containing protein n=1 Tax=Cynara cardunculus var. scolymus TaxID=59895 RepID=A0A103XJ76_CYNCS|nr:Threonyl/alanyl tRNA synthetase, class II-like, putative editing domain-containing protein [Cynara cardunculus var. scolymus]